MKKLIFILTALIFCSRFPDLQAQNTELREKPSVEMHDDILGHIYPTQSSQPDKELRITIPLNHKYKPFFKENPSDFEWRISDLPEGAKFDYDLREIIWLSQEKPLGKYPIRIEVRYKGKIDELYMNIDINDDMETGFLPAIGASIYTPKTNDKVGTFTGISVQYALYSWIYRNDNSGPCLGQWYLSFDLLESCSDNIEGCFIYGTGVDLSFERNPERNWLLPYFGAFFGWMNQADIGYNITFAPRVGIWLYADEYLFVNAGVSYLLPASDFEEFQGLKTTLSVNFSLW